MKSLIIDDAQFIPFNRKSSICNCLFNYLFIQALLNLSYE